MPELQTAENFTREDLFSRSTVKPPQKEPEAEKPFDVQAWIEKQRAAKKEFFGNIEGLCEKLASELQEEKPDTLRQLMNFYSSLASKWSMTNTIGLFLQKPDIQRPVTIREAEKKFGHKPKRGVRWASILVPVIPRAKPAEEAPAQNPDEPSVRDGQVDGEARPAGEEAQQPVEEKKPRRAVYFKAVRCVVDLGRETEGPAILESEGANLHAAAELLAAIKQYAGEEGIEFDEQGWTGQSAGGRAGVTEDGQKKITVADCTSVDYQFRVAAHEAAHHLLGHVGNKDVSKETKEIQAELTAYIVGQGFGIPSDYSSTYLKAFGADKQAIYDNLRVVGRVAKKIINGIDRQLRIGVTVDPEITAEQSPGENFAEDVVDEAALEEQYRQDTIVVWQKKDTDFAIPNSFDPSHYSKVAEITGSNLGHAFTATQSVDGRWQNNAEEGITVLDKRARSTSVGDVLELEGGFYAVTRDGFDRIEQVENVGRSARV